MSSLPASAAPSVDYGPHADADDIVRDKSRSPIAPRAPTAVLVVVPTLDGGASDAAAVELVRILAGAGYAGIVVSRAVVRN
jgi:hypothetical protein